jgi:EpsI family protein
MKTSSQSIHISVIILLATSFFVFLIAHRGEPKVVRTNLENMPMHIAEYTGMEDFFPDSVYEELKADRHVYRHYRSPDGTQIDLYIGYYGTAKGGRTGHNPYACLSGAGWGIIDIQKAILPFGEGRAAVNALVARKGAAYETVLHWYQSDKDKVLATGIQQNIQRFIGRIWNNRNDGAFVRVSMQTNQDGLETAHEKVFQFAASILHMLPEYWPEEK